MFEKLDFNFVDIHCHILSGVDDGPKEFKDSMKMIEQAYNDGIRAIVLTPHYHPTKCLMEYEQIRKKYDEFKLKVKQTYPQMKIFLGREVMYTSDVLVQLENKKKLTISNSDYILVEYSPVVEYSYLRSSINSLLQMGYKPIIAHVERYICICEDIDKLKELKNMGALIQINAGSVIGTFGNDKKRTVRKILKEYIADFVATDAHDAVKRNPAMYKAALYIYKKYGEQYAKEVLYINAVNILKNT